MVLWFWCIFKNLEPTILLSRMLTNWNWWLLKFSDTRPTLVNPLSPKAHAKNIGKVGVQGATVAKANGLGARDICSFLFTAPSPPSQHLQPWAQIDRERERERERERVCVCVCEREREDRCPCSTFLRVLSNGCSQQWKVWSMECICGVFLAIGERFLGNSK
jgi:hypothetical protein